MYLGFLVDIPDVKGKITQKRKGNSVYISYEIGRKYDLEVYHKGAVDKLTII